MTKQKFDDFDKYADDYRFVHSANVKMTGADSFYFAEQKAAELKKREYVKNAYMLDVGCGDGMTELYVQKYFPHWCVEGIDVSEKSIKKAMKIGIANTKFSLYNGLNIPFDDNSFDIVFMAAVLHHIDPSLHEQLLRDIYRVLKVGGRLYIFEHNPFNPVTRYLVNTCSFDKDAKLLKPGRVRNFLKKASFSNIRIHYTLFFPRKGILSKLIFLENMLSWLPLGGQYYSSSIK